MKTLEDNLAKLRSVIAKQSGSSVSAPHKAASIPLLNYKVHGFEDQFDEILKKIRISSDQGSSAVGIVGIGGSGKTTLASMVFNAREVREKYQITIWASLTSTLNKKESTRGSVFREILSGVQNNDSLKTMLQKIKSYQAGAKMADHVLDKYIDHFKEALGRNRGKYLIVLDDVWETEYWFAEKEEMTVGHPKCILSREWIQKTSGTIMVTSSLEEMADAIVGKRNLYMISPVSDEACFDIFLDRVTKYGYFTREDKHLKNLKKEIVDKCFGLPLAACSVADIFVAEHLEEAEKAAMKKKEAANDKAEVEGEGSAAKDKIEADGEGDTSKPKAEVKGEDSGSTAKDKIDAEGEGEASAAKDKPEGEGDVLEAEAKAKGAVQKAEVEASERKVEAETDGLKAELAAEGAKTDATDRVEETAVDSSKAEEQAVLEADASKTKTEVIPPSDIVTGLTARKLAQRVMKAFRKARETKKEDK